MSNNRSQIVVLKGYHQPHHHQKSKNQKFATKTCQTLCSLSPSRIKPKETPCVSNKKKHLRFESSMQMASIPTCKMSDGSIVHKVLEFVRTRFIPEKVEDRECSGGGNSREYHISRRGSIVDQTIQFVTKEYEQQQETELVEAPQPPRALTLREHQRRQQQVARGARCPLGAACTHGCPVLSRVGNLPAYIPAGVKNKPRVVGAGRM